MQCLVSESRARVGLASLGLSWHLWKRIHGESHAPKYPSPSQEMPQALGLLSLGLGLLPQLQPAPSRHLRDVAFLLAALHQHCHVLPCPPSCVPLLSQPWSVPSATLPHAICFFMLYLPIIPHYYSSDPIRTSPDLRILSMHCCSPSPFRSSLPVLQTWPSSHHMEIV